MEPTTIAPPTQHIYRGQGSHSVHSPLYEPEETSIPAVPTIADVIPVSRIMTREITCARDDLELGALIDLMVSRRIGCVPIVDDRGRPVGMVTKFDLIEQLIDVRNHGAALQALKAIDVMMPLAITLDEHATLAHAAAMMSAEDVHHVPIVSDTGPLIGIISTMDIVRWLAANDGLLARELPAP